MVDQKGHHRMSLSISHASYEANGTSLLTDVTLDVASATCTAVIGPNGAGKSTLLRLASGDIRPTSGSVHIEGRSLAQMNVPSRAKLRSVLAHQLAADVTFTVQQVVAMGRYPYRFDQPHDPREDQGVIDSVINSLDLSGLRHRQVRSLSGGEQQRVAIARVLAQQAPVVLLDEPTTALDIKHQQSVMALIKALGASGHAVVAVLHDLNMAPQFDQVILLDKGRIAAAGTPSDVLTGEGLTTVYGHSIDVVDHPTRPGILMVPRPQTGQEHTDDT